MRLLLVRHCEAHRGGNGEDHGLTAPGKDQASRLYHYIPPNIDTILSSPSPRALQTAQEVADRTGLSVEIMDDLAEIGEVVQEENLNAFIARAGKTLDRISHDYEHGNVIAFTHAGFIMAAIRAVFDIPTPGTGARLEPDYGSVTGWYHDGETWFLENYNVRASTDGTG